MKRYQVQLSNEERTGLQKLISAGVASTRKLTRARILLKVDEGLTKTEVSQALDVSINTVANVCRSFQEQRLEAIERKKPGCCMRKKRRRVLYAPPTFVF
jgi:DNA-directed RNA polymerase specialized sigma24 family protein